VNMLLARFVLLVGGPAMALAHRSGFCTSVLALRGLERLRWRIGALGAWVRYHSALREVPAYRRFVESRSSGADPRAVLALANVPPCDKRSYVQAYSLADRCAGGRIPTAGLVVDESSGTGGAPTNWLRGADERAASGRAIRLGLRNRLGAGPHFFINAFALGPWATGINLTLSLSSWSRVKSVGPDIAKVENTLREFGAAERYVIFGYPPFLKQLVDQADVDWQHLDVTMIFGGEGMSESMRGYLLAKGVRAIYGSYGASDLDLNIAAETDFTLALRRVLAERATLANRLMRWQGVAPMIFQFNPADFFVETTVDGELLVTACRPGQVTPKVRYNIHDRGQVVRFGDVRRALEAEGLTTAGLDAKALDLPLLFLYGRSDSAVAYYGCKIPPSDVQEAIFRVPALAVRVDGFQLETFEDEATDKRLVLHLEEGVGHGIADPGSWAGPVFDTLAELNQDFREARRIAPGEKQPTIVSHSNGTGPFEGADIRIKRKYART
jgi:phenylacetate-CoA ligase